MKKHYGPIVLGIIALTLAAPVSNATTVLAEEATGSESTTEQSNSSESTESKNQTGTTTPTTDEYSGKTDLILQRPDQPAPGLYKISDAEFTFSKLDTYENQTIKTDDLYHDGEGYIVTDKDGKSTSDTHTVIPMKIDKDGNITVNPDYITGNGEIRTKLGLTVEGVRSQIDTFISKDFTTTYLNVYSSSDPDKFNEVYSKLSSELKAEDTKVSDEMTSDALSSLENEVVKTIRTYTTIVGLKIIQTDDYVGKGEDKATIETINKTKLNPRAIEFIPIVKGAEVYFLNHTGKNRDEYLGIKFNEDGNKIVKAEVTDSNKKPIKTNTKIKVWMSNFLSDVVPNYAVETNNTPVNNTNNTNHSNNNSSHHTTTNSNNTKPIENNTPDKNVHTVTNVVFLTTPYTDTRLFDDDGNIVPNVSLQDNTQWVVDKFMTIDNVVYGRVATNEWVKMSNGLNITPKKSVVHTHNKITGLVDANGKKVTNRALAGNTPWFSDMTAEINGQVMYRVSNTEWVPASDVNQE